MQWLIHLFLITIGWPNGSKDSLGCCVKRAGLFESLPVLDFNGLKDPSLEFVLFSLNDELILITSFFPDKLASKKYPINAH